MSSLGQTKLTGILTSGQLLSATVNQGNGQQNLTSSYAISASHAVNADKSITASYALNAGGSNINTGSLVTTSSFNSFTQSVSTSYVPNSATSSMTVSSASYASSASSASVAGFATSASHALISDAAISASYWSGSIKNAASSSYASTAVTATTATSATTANTANSASVVSNIGQIDTARKVGYRAGLGVTLDWGNMGLADANQFVSIDWGNRWLMAGDGATHTLDWQNRVLSGSNWLLQNTGTSANAIATVGQVNALTSSIVANNSFTSSYLTTSSFNSGTSSMSVLSSSHALSADSALTASYALNAGVTPNTSFTSSYLTTASFNQVSSSFETTASFASYTQSAATIFVPNSVTNSMTVGTASYVNLLTNTNTSSFVNAVNVKAGTGSNFPVYDSVGNLSLVPFTNLRDTQGNYPAFVGEVLTTAGAGTIWGFVSGSTILGAVTSASHAVSADNATTASYALNGGGVTPNYGFTSSYLTTASFNGATSSFVPNSVTSSMSVLSSSHAVSANTSKDVVGTHINSTAYTLIGNLNEVTVDWTDCYLINAAGSTAVDWANRNLYDSSGISSADWQNRFLSGSAWKMQNTGSTRDSLVTVGQLNDSTSSIVVASSSYASTASFLNPVNTLSCSVVAASTAINYPGQHTSLADHNGILYYFNAGNSFSLTDGLGGFTLGALGSGRYHGMLKGADANGTIATASAGVDFIAPSNTGSMSVLSSSYAGTASVLLGSVQSASYAATASVLLGSVQSASYATTASMASSVDNPLAINTGDRTLRDSTGAYSAQWDSRLLWDSNNYVSVDYGNYQLKTSGRFVGGMFLTAAVDWYNSLLYNYNANISLDWNNNFLSQSAWRMQNTGSTRDSLVTLGQLNDKTGSIAVVSSSYAATASFLLGSVVSASFASNIRNPVINTGNTSLYFNGNPVLNWGNQTLSGSAWTMQSTGSTRDSLITLGQFSDSTSSIVVVSSSYAPSASHAVNADVAITASYALNVVPQNNSFTSSYLLSSSFNSATSSMTVLSASHASNLNNVVINTGTSTLYWSGNPVLNWNSQSLNDGFGSPSLDWTNHVLFDGSSQTAIHWSSRTLQDASSAVTLDWNGLSLQGIAAWTMNHTGSARNNLVTVGQLNDATGSVVVTSASYATTASYALNGGGGGGSGIDQFTAWMTTQLFT